MDFHSLKRKDLQSLCKKNKIPANLTNAAMADALTSLDFVEGIEEFLKPCESETANSSVVSPEKSEKVSASAPRTLNKTCGRTRGKDRDVHEKKVEETPAMPTTRRQAAATSVRSTMPTTRRQAAATSVRSKLVNSMKECELEENIGDQTEKVGPSTRRQAAATSVRLKLETSKNECEPEENIGDQTEAEKKEALKTPAAVHTNRRREVTAKSSVRYSTRRSTRLPVKTGSEASTQENEKSRTITDDVFPEEINESLLDSKQCSIDKNEELDKNGIDLTASKESSSVNEKDSEVVSGQDSNILAENQIELKVGAQEVSVHSLLVDVLNEEAEKGLEVDESIQNNEDLDKNGIDLKASEVNLDTDKDPEIVSGQDSNVLGEVSLDTDKDREIVSGQDSNVFVEFQIEVEGGVQEASADSFAVDDLNKDVEKGLEIEESCHINKGLEEVLASEINVFESGKQMDSGDEDSGVVDAFSSENEKDEASNEVNGDKQIGGSAVQEVSDEEDLCHDALTRLNFPDASSKQLNQENERHCDETFEFDEKNVTMEEKHNDENFECAVGDKTEHSSVGAGERELSGNQKEKVVNAAEEDRDDEIVEFEVNDGEDCHNDEIFEFEVNDDTEYNSDGTREGELMGQKKEKVDNVAEEHNDDKITECEASDGAGGELVGETKEKVDIVAEEDRHDENAEIFKCEVDDDTEYDGAREGESIEQKKEKVDIVAEDCHDKMFKCEVENDAEYDGAREGESTEQKKEKVDNVAEEDNDDKITECEAGDDVGGGELVGEKKEKAENVAEEDHDDEIIEREVNAGAESDFDGSGEVDADEVNVDGTAVAPLLPLTFAVPNVESTGEVESFKAETNIDCPDMNLLGQLKCEKEPKLCEELLSEADIEFAGEEPIKDCPDMNLLGELKCEKEPKLCEEHLSEADIEFAGEEPIKVDDTKAELYAAAHDPFASPMPDTASKLVSTLMLDSVHNPFAFAETNPVFITGTSCLSPVKTPVRKSVSKTSAVKKTAAQKHVSDDKENMDNSGRKLVLTKVKLKKNKGNSNNANLDKLSLRQLTKMLKELTISKDPNMNATTNTKVASSRPALQTLAKNRMIDETEK